MSYSLRNTILLAITLIMIIGGSAAWLYLNEYQVLKDRQEELERQSRELTRLNADVSRFDETFERNDFLNHSIDNYPKSLLPNNKLSLLYEYARRADPGSVFMNFSFTDSTQVNEYGYINFAVDGAIDFRQLRNFILTLEAASPLVKVNTVQIRPTNNTEDLNEVGFRITAAAYYDRTGRESEFEFASARTATITRNPFFPLVHDVPTNEHNRIDVERSRLTALGDRFIYLIDQNGQLQRLGIRDRVHLGYLESISINEQSATFYLNKGGLVERLTLRLQP